MNPIKLITHTLFLFVITVTSSCVKEHLQPEASCSCEEPSVPSEIKKKLTAHTWKIEEVKDPYMGIRYKRGIKEDQKNFAAARYQYHDNQTLTGTDWFGQPIENTCYTLLANEKLKVITPLCSSIEEILTISAVQFIYKSADGSLFTLIPSQQTDCPGKGL